MRHDFDSYQVRECQSGEAPLQSCENIAQWDSVFALLIQRTQN